MVSESQPDSRQSFVANNTMQYPLFFIEKWAEALKVGAAAQAVGAEHELTVHLFLRQLVVVVNLVATERAHDEVGISPLVVAPTKPTH